jgi:Arc/MetJ-type ribon-helix-helix transcriptional regulator
MVKFKKTTVEIPEELYKEFIELAVKKFGYYGAFKKAIKEAIELWLEREKMESKQR